MPSQDRSVYSDIIGIVLSGGALLGVLCTISTGRSSNRLIPLVDFLVLSTIGFIGSTIAGAALRRRRRIARSGAVPRGVRLRSHPTVQARILCQAFAWSSFVSTVPTAFCGFRTGLWFDIALTCLAACLIALFELSIGRVGLMFDTDGLHVHFRRVSFFIRWANISRVDLSKPQPLHLLISFRDTADVLRSFDPRGGSGGNLVRAYVFSGEQIKIDADVGDFDGIGLARAIKNSLSTRTREPN